MKHLLKINKENVVPQILHNNVLCVTVQLFFAKSFFFFHFFFSYCTMAQYYCHVVSSASLWEV